MTRLEHLEHEMIRIQALIEGLDVLTDQALTSSTEGLSRDERQAHNAIPPLIETIHARFEALMDEVGNINLEVSKAGKAKRDA